MLIRRNQRMAEHGGAAPPPPPLDHNRRSGFRSRNLAPRHIGPLEIEKSHKSCCQRAAPCFSVSSVRLDSSSRSLALWTSPTNYSRPHSTSTATDAHLSFTITQVFKSVSFVPKYFFFYFIYSALNSQCFLTTACVSSLSVNVGMFCLLHFFENVRSKTRSSGNLPLVGAPIPLPG